jgi:hypothetical protein
MRAESSPAIILCAAALFLIPQRCATAQDRNAGPAPHLAMLVGIVVDSINGGALAGATVMVDGTPLLATAGADGRFRIDSIPPGSYRLAVFHPMLDSLGMTIGSQQMRFGPDSIRQVLLSTPSAGTLIGEWCPAASRRLGPAALVGRVVDPETSAPISGARVTMAWEETELDVATISRRRVPRMREATSDETGRFALCGMSADTRGTLQAERGRNKTPELPVSMAGRTFVMQMVLVGSIPVNAAETPKAAGDSAVTAASRQTPRSTGSATVAGRVVDGVGRPVPGARVSVDGTGISALSDSAGSFVVARVPTGSWVVAARRVGFRPSDVAVNVLPRRTQRITLVLQPSPTTLATVTTTGAAIPGLERVGFADRKRMGMGRYLTSDQIAERRPMRTTELFETIPGIQVASNGRGGFSLRSARDGCVTVFIDGMQWTETPASDLDMTLTPEQISAVEVYSASTRPGEFTASGQSQCAAAVFWTKTRVGQRQ